MIGCEHSELPRWNPWLITPNELETQEQTLALINTEISGRLDRQSESLGKIDGKAGLLLGSTSQPPTAGDSRADSCDPRR